jgi:hypothetical protein
MATDKIPKYSGNAIDDTLIVVTVYQSIENGLRSSTVNFSCSEWMRFRYPGFMVELIINKELSGLGINIDTPLLDNDPKLTYILREISALRRFGSLTDDGKATLRTLETMLERVCQLRYVSHSDKPDELVPITESGSK